MTYWRDRFQIKYKIQVIKPKDRFGHEVRTRYGTVEFEDKESAETYIKKYLSKNKGVSYRAIPLGASDQQ